MAIALAIPIPLSFIAIRTARFFVGTSGGFFYSYVGLFSNTLVLEITPLS